MDKFKQPGIKFENVILSSEKFWRKPEIPENLNINLEFKLNKSINPNTKKGIVELECILQLEDSSKNIYVLINPIFIGIFSESETKNMDLDTFINKHAPALLIPYIREHITNISSKAGITPIILPPINIIAFIAKDN